MLQRKPMVHCNMTTMFFCIHVCADLFLPLSSLKLLVPPLRLLSAAMWQVAQRREVLDYEMLDEFVTLVTATVPDLLGPKQRGKLLLRLRAKVSSSSKSVNNGTTMSCLMDTVKSVSCWMDTSLFFLHLSDYSRAVQKWGNSQRFVCTASSGTNPPTRIHRSKWEQCYLLACPLKLLVTDGW